MNLEQGLKALKISYSAKQLEQLDQMLDLLNEWNERHNLTRYVTREDQIIYHVLDSLSASPFFLDYKTVLDIGTGAGFPGIPLAILYPDKKFHLVDSNGKKIAYIKMLIKALGLENVQAYHERIEKLDIAVDAITARALASTDKIKVLTQHMKPQVYILFIGKEEGVGKLHTMQVPGSNKTHKISILKP